MKLPSHISYLLGLIGVAICAGIAAALYYLVR